MRGALAACTMVAFASAVSACGGVYYTVNMNAAEARLEQARQMGAEQQAPFEYYYAREHLHQAQIEAAEASYSDAATYAEIAERYAQNAIDLITHARKAEGK
jgi:hypothetical protein